MKTAPILFLILFLASPAGAWTHPFGIRIYKTAGKEPTVSIYSEEKNFRSISVAEAAKIVSATKQKESSIAVGLIVDAGVPTFQYASLLKAILKNSSMQLDFVEGRYRQGKISEAA